MSSYQMLLVLCLLVIVSYLFDFVARKTKFPSVILIMGAGVALQFILPKEIVSRNVGPLLQILGTVGLILIVLEGGLDIHISRDKKKLILRSFLSALVVLLATTFALAGIFYYLIDAPLNTALINAVPLAVISSSIAIPSAAALAPESKEFVVYESTFSDILGIILSTFLMVNTTITVGSFGILGLEIMMVTVLSALFSLILLKLIETITHKVKFFLILSLLVLLYVVGKSFFHLPSLLLVFIFGLLLRNRDILIIPDLKRFFKTEEFEPHFDQFMLITSESAFIIRTFFFVVFGFTVPLASLAEGDVLLLGGLVFVAILLIRYLYMLISKTEPVNVLTFIAPRGLITILLFLQVPAEHAIPGLSQGVLFIVICLSLVALTIGSLLSPTHKRPQF
ncbi:MAG TPA: sodium:proton antiporter [Bacteroidia bacterium]|nr:sodium:proton antiporter [Bacteroidia bacterium]